MFQRAKLMRTSRQGRLSSHPCFRAQFGSRAAQPILPVGQRNRGNQWIIVDVPGSRPAESIHSIYSSPRWVIAYKFIISHINYYILIIKMHSFKRYKIKEIIISVHSLCKHWLPRCVGLIIIYFYIHNYFENTNI